MISKLFLLFIFITPFFGKTLNYFESIIFFSVPAIILLFLFFKEQKIYLSKKTIIVQLALIFLYLVSLIFSKNIGSSYYQFFTFLNTVLIFSIAINIIKPDDFSSGLIAASVIYSIIFLLNNFGIISLDKDITGDNFILQVWGHSYVAELIVLTIPILLSQIFFKKNKIGSSIILSIIIISLFLSNSRSALISLVSGIIFFKVNQKINLKFKVIFIIVSTIALIFSFYRIHQTSQSQKTYDGDRLEYWQQAVHGFVESPIFGNGPNTFPYINKTFQKNSDLSTSSAHSSFLTFLSDNGIIFALLFFFLVIKSLTKTYRSNNVFFVCGIIALIYSLIDFSWDSPGILIISLYFIFYYQLFENQKQSTKLTHVYLLIITSILLLFTISKTSSDIFFIRGDYEKSLISDPFNLNSYLAIIKNTNTESTLWKNKSSISIKLYNNEIKLYEALIEVVPVAQKEIYYFKIIRLNQTNIENYLQLLSYYRQNNFDKDLFPVFQQISKNIPIKGLFGKQRADLCKNYYHYAVKIFPNNPDQAISLFEKTVELEPAFGYFQVDLANAYWYNNQKEKAVNQLNKCLNYLDSKEQCQEYLASHLNLEFSRPGTDEFINFIDNNL